MRAKDLCLFVERSRQSDAGGKDLRPAIEKKIAASSKEAVLTFSNGATGPAQPVELGATHAHVQVPGTGLLLDGLTRVAVKMVLNAISTCVMVRLGRVMGNTMIYVVPSNLKLIDRATRYISRLTSLDYVAANELLFEAIEYVEPRMQAGKPHPPVVGLAALRHEKGMSFEEAEIRIQTLTTLTAA